MVRLWVGALLAAITLAMVCAPTPSANLSTSATSPPAPTASSTTASPAAPSSAVSPVAVTLAAGVAPPAPYVRGKTDAPVTLDEYADFQ